MEMKNYEMTQEQLDEIMNACKPTPVMYLSGGVPMFNTPQENANHAWQKLGEELGFKHMTVRPNGKGDRFFSAEEKDK
jgi:predicted TIM-barrel fold metal-dependent hydrolase